MKLRYAMVCSSNQNRSMEAHALLKREGFDVSSYGTGQHVKQPGPSLKETNINDFGTPYKYMLENLRRKDPELLYGAILDMFFAMWRRECTMSRRLNSMEKLMKHEIQSPQT